MLFSAIFLAILAVHGGKGKIKCKNLNTELDCHGKIASEGGICVWQKSSSQCVNGEDAEIDERAICTGLTDYYSCNKYPPCSFVNMQCVYTQACGDITTKSMCKAIRGCSWNAGCAEFGENEEEAQDCLGEDNAMDCESDPERNCVWSGLSCGVFDAMRSCPRLNQQWKCETYRCVWDAQTNKCSMFNRATFCPSILTEQECTNFSCLWMFGKKCMDNSMFGEEAEFEWPTRAPTPLPTVFSPTRHMTTAIPTRDPTVALPCRVGPKGMHCPFRGGHCNNKNPSTALEGSLCVTDCTIHQGHYWCYTDQDEKKWGWCYQQKHQTCTPPTQTPTSKPTVTSPFVVHRPKCLTGKKGLKCPDASENCGIQIPSTADEDQRCMTDCTAQDGKYWCYTVLQPFKLWGWCKIQDAHECRVDNKRGALQLEPPFLQKSRKGPSNPEPISNDGNGDWFGFGKETVLVGCIATSVTLVLCICYFAFAISKRYAVPDMVDLDFIRDVDAFGFSEYPYSQYRESESPRV